MLYYFTMLTFERKIINHFCKDIVKNYLQHILAIYLFGSRATKTAKFDSDYDFLIIVDIKNILLKKQIYDLAYEFLLKYQADISLKIVTIEQWSEMKQIFTPFYKNVITKGEKLWEKESRSSLLSEFKNQRLS